MGINRFIYVLFLASVAMLGWLGYTYVNQNKAQLKYTAEVEHTYKVIITSQYCEKLLLDAESKQRGYIITGDMHFRNAANESVTKIDSSWNALKDVTADNPKQRVNIHLLHLAIQQRLVILEENFKLSASVKDRLTRLGSGQLLMDKIHVYIRDIENEEEMLLIERNNAKNHYQALNFTFVKYGFLFACLVCVVAIMLIIRELRKRIRAQHLLEKTILDLKRSNEEVEQITFTASHDLQEPLRKIRTLGTLFTKKMDRAIGPDEKDILQRIDRATEKMQLLINDLVDFTILLNTTEKPVIVDLDTLFKENFERLSKGTDAQLTMYSVLPYIRAHKAQLEILFTQILDNAFKYRDPQKQLQINVTYRLTEGDNITAFIWKTERARRYHQITVSDNGQGFDNVFREKIFILFQRLHTQDEFKGKGLGLALAKRIMTNHYGHIEANGTPGLGASFSMYFPLD